MKIDSKDLLEIHTRVYKECGYPDTRYGLKALRRARKWVENNKEAKGKAPAGIQDDIRMGMLINKEIEIHLLKKKGQNVPEMTEVTSTEGSTNIIIEKSKES